MQTFRFLIVGFILAFAWSAFAANDPMAKEETTPPLAEGAITAEQIPPVYSKAAKPAAAPKEHAENTETSGLLG